MWIESPEVRIGPVARVAMVAAVDGEYSFAVPEALVEQVAPGKRVLVPFGRCREPQPAFCISTGQETWTSTLKPVADVVDEHRLLDDALLELGRWISRYYCCPLGRTLAAMVPEPVRSRSGYRKIRVIFAATAPAAGVKLSTARKKVLAGLADHPEGRPLDELVEAGASKATISAMVKAGLLREEIRREAPAAPSFDVPRVEPVFDLEPAQAAAAERISGLVRDEQFRAVLLYGKSGSGKTEVYVRAIRAALAAGRQAILLIPEIALTTQIVQRLVARFQDVAVIHSGLTGVQRSLTYTAIATGDKRVIIGTRSAVFAPCPRLGLIVVDEEQEPSYKNQQSPRFSTRDVAIKRAQLLSIPVVLGSATPALETWYNAGHLKHFERIDLPGRIAGLPMPVVEFVDLRAEQREQGGAALVSRIMATALRETLAAGQQAVVLLNRRGYANYMMCSRCRNPVVCPNCRTSMVFHQTTGQVRCHYCTARMVVPVSCGNPACAGKLIRWGMGTQRIEETLSGLFPDARLARADSDTMLKPADYERLVHDLAERRIDILVGTQMIAKGLDFPEVAFVGVINADTATGTPDFRAAERTFQLVTQVAGRAGRARAGGRVVVQSLSGLSEALRFAMVHDYCGFAEQELPVRHNLGWPPFSRLARVLISHHSPNQARDEAARLATGLREFTASKALRCEVLGPQTAPLSRLRNLYRYDLILRAPNAGVLMSILEQLRHADVLTTNTPHTLVDVDPTSLA